MFNQIFRRSDGLRRHESAPLREERLAYLRHWADGGAPERMLRQLAQYLVVITERLHLGSNRSVTM